VPVKRIRREGYGRITRGTRVLELVTASREARLGKGGRSTSPIASKVEDTHQRGWSSTPTARRLAVARGVTRFGGAIIRSAAAGRNLLLWVLVKTSVPGTFEVEAPI
jgi:hypothetical protein